jgi:coenzyme F420-dependent glucose-6-phosphate dehydrogenase
MCAIDAHQPESAVEQAVAAEAAGFDAVVVPDPLQPWVDEGGAAGFVWSWFGAVAARTVRIGLIVTVSSAAFRYHPVVLAQAAATVDRLSGGRFELGLGTGIRLHEAPLGAPPTTGAERLARLEETAGIVRRLLDGERVDHTGGHFRVLGVRLASSPASRVPVWIAAAGPGAARVAGRLGDGVVVSVKDVAVARRRVVDPARRAAAGEGRPLGVLATRWCVLGSDDAEALAAVAPLRGLRAPGRDEVVDPGELRRRADALARDELLGRFCVVRHVAELANAYRPLVEDLAADTVAIQVAAVDPVGTVRRIGADVLPALRATSTP